MHIDSWSGGYQFCCEEVFPCTISVKRLVQKKVQFNSSMIPIFIIGFGHPLAVYNLFFSPHPFASIYPSLKLGLVPAGVRLPGVELGEVHTRPHSPCCGTVRRGRMPA